jgi:hypothetical protein
MNIFEERGITSNDMIMQAFVYYESVRLCTCMCVPQQLCLLIQLFVDIYSPGLHNG